MNKEFIPYEQSLELKELGFNENCFASYTYDRCNEGAMAFDIKEQNGLRWSTNTNEECKQYKEPCTAPLYQQAFRWFREKYNLHSHIEYSKGFYEYWILLDVVGYDTYEEAELACLKKLIVTAKAWDDIKKEYHKDTAKVAQDKIVANKMADDYKRL